MSNMNKQHHSFLIVFNKIVDTKQIIFNKISTLVQPEVLQKIKTNNYSDIIWFNQNIKVDDAKNIINRFNYSGSEANGIKIYVIENVDRVSKNVSNLLLKFLEEPPKNTYAILTTNSLHKVIPTIKSRCYIEKTKSQNSSDDNSDIKNIYKDINEYQNDKESGLVDELINFSKTLISNNNIISRKMLSDQFSKFDNQTIEKLLNYLFLITHKSEILDCINKNRLNVNKNLLFIILDFIYNNNNENI